MAEPAQPKAGGVDHTFTLAAPGELPSGNKHWSWQKRARVVKEIRGYVGIAAASERNRMGIPSCREGERRRVQITLVRGHGEKLLDPDNATMGLKPCLDGLVDAGWAYRDSEKAIAYAVSQERGERAQLRIHVASL